MKTLLILFLTMNQVFAQQNYGVTAGVPLQRNYGVTSGGVASQHFHVVAICSGEYGHKCNTPGAYHYVRMVIPITFPMVEDRAIYGPGNSLIGAVRHWGPSFFYPLHPTIRPYINQADRDLLDNRYRLDLYLMSSKISPYRHSDTFYVNIPKSEFEKLK